MSFGLIGRSYGGDVSECRTLRAAIGRRECLAVARNAFATLRRGCLGRCRWRSELGFVLLLMPPFSEDTLIDVEPVLLRSNNHAGSHEAHEGDALVRCEAMAIDEVCADQTACPAETSFAVDCYAFAADVDHVVCQLNKASHKLKRWTCAVVEDHVQMLDAESSEVRWAVKLGVQAYYKANVARLEVREDVLERSGQLRLLHVWDCGRELLVSRIGGRDGDRWYGMFRWMLRTGES